MLDKRFEQISCIDKSHAYYVIISYYHISKKMSRVRDTDIKNCTHYFFDDVISKVFDPNNIKIDKKSYKNILIYYARYVTPNSVKLCTLLSTTQMDIVKKILEIK